MASLTNPSSLASSSFNVASPKRICKCLGNGHTLAESLQLVDQLVSIHNLVFYRKDEHGLKLHTIGIKLRRQISDLFILYTQFVILSSIGIPESVSIDKSRSRLYANTFNVLIIHLWFVLKFYINWNDHRLKETAKTKGANTCILIHLCVVILLKHSLHRIDSSIHRSSLISMELARKSFFDE